MRQRLDQLLVEKGLVATRSRARDLITRQAVRVDGQLAAKPAVMVADTAVIDIDADANAHVARSAQKLIDGLDAFKFDPAGCTALDLGASTGGFTEVLLQRGATLVHAVDVGRDQLHASLREDPRVIDHNGIDARFLEASMFNVGDVPGLITAVVADVSFISLRKLLPVPLGLVQPGGWLVALVKPQFEQDSKDSINKAGLLKDPAAGLAALAAVEAWLAALPGWRVVGTRPTSLPGKSGNQEYLIGALRHD
jgi:23S rRNA (cytidine1920-2'-O)/16S rRNA (cytidine1409-2'-O)-methyltransferase